MKKNLFFDDNKLFGRDNVVRKYGKPEMVAVYNDGVTSTDYPCVFSFRLDNGKYRLLYFAKGKDFEGMKLFSAISDDGINFSPEQLYDLSENPEKKFSHEVMTLIEGQEVAYIYEDKYCDNPDERYKLLMGDGSDMANLQINDTVYTSPDLINWNLKEGCIWGDGTEPLTSVFYNKKHKTHTIIERSFWGVRYAGYKETKDWETFTKYQPCVNVDSLDERLAEVYGMYAFEYDDMYIGLVQLYRGLNSEYNAKFSNGIIDTQLAYSLDGRYWLRSLREPFISGVDCDWDTKYKMVWVPGMIRCDDGSVNFYASASEFEHGQGFGNLGSGKILVFKMRCDGFISLSTDKKDEEASVITREKVWHGGNIHVNLKAEKATMAVYLSGQNVMVGGNVLGASAVIEGFTHEDCVEFSGDSTDWEPQYKSGKKIADLAGKTLVFELKFTNGEVFSFSGDFTDVYNTQAARYREFGILPE